MNRPALLDNTVLTNFAQVGRPDLVLAAWPGASTTAAVMGEYQAGAAVHKFPATAWQALAVVDMTPAETDLAQRLGNRLGKGEREGLAVAASRGGLFVSDDLDARRQAQELNVPTSGSIGILLLSIQHARLTLKEGNDLLSRFIASGYRSPVTSLDGLLH